MTTRTNFQAPSVTGYCYESSKCQRLCQTTQRLPQLKDEDENRWSLFSWRLQLKSPNELANHLNHGQHINTNNYNHHQNNPKHHFNNNTQLYLKKKPNLYNSYTINQNHNHNRSLLVSILLPLLCMFLMPSLKLVDQNQNHNYDNYQHSSIAHQHHHHHQQTTEQSSQPKSHPTYSEQQLPVATITTSKLLLTLLQLPFDRLRLVSGLQTFGVDGKDVISSRQDLQEEETHMQMLVPAEHRNLYGVASSAGSGPARSAAQRVSELSTSYQAPAASGHSEQQAGESVAVAPSDYGISSADQVEGIPMGTVEGTSVAEPVSSNSIGGGGGGLQTRGDLPAVRALNVKCEKNHMTVNIVFDRPFYGMVFSKGHYNDQKCVHLPANSGQTSINFDIHLGKCGMSSSDASGNPNAALQLQQQQQQALASQSQPQQPNGLYIENTIIIQYDPQVQEIYDQARKLRCTWYDYYEKSVTFRPYNVDMLDAVTANFLGDNIQCWMQIQVGKGPWSSEVAGIVKIGQTMTMVLAIKDDENRFDMLVRNCVAHDGKHQPIQLVDEYGCVARPKIMAKFQKVRNFGPAATVVSYAHFQAFKFPDSMSVHFQCVIQVCRYECPEPVCSGSGPGAAAAAGAGATATTSGDSMQGGQSSPGADYTASATDIVSSKEPLPVGIHTSGDRAYHFMANNSMVASSSSPSSSGGHGNSVNLKLDESQGRVQVKLDTSMMAGGRMPPLGHSGALPPHLLHAAASEQGPAPVPPGYIPARPSPAGHMNTGSPSYFKQHPAAAAGSGSLLPGGHRNSQGMHLATQGGATNGRPPMLNVRAQLAPSAHRSAHFSSPYHHQQHHHHQQQQQSQQPHSPAVLTHRFYATNRLGDLPEVANSDDQQQQQPTKQQTTSIDMSTVNSELASHLNLQPAPLSLIAVPRGLRTSHRERRSVSGQPAMGGMNATTGNNGLDHQHLHMALGLQHAMAARSLPGGPEEDSTSIKTQKTIQVVSPDDVAFSLIDDFGLSNSEPTTINGFNSKRASNGNSTVCFSAARLIVAVLVTVAALASGLVVVAYLIMRQRANNQMADPNDKLASLYDPTEQETANSVCEQQQQRVAASCHLYGANYVQPHPVNVCRSQPEVDDAYEASEAIRAANMISHRQRNEIQQRNNYLARLYSQFVPANYWR